MGPAELADAYEQAFKERPTVRYPFEHEDEFADAWYPNGLNPAESVLDDSREIVSYCDLENPDYCESCM